MGAAILTFATFFFLFAGIGSAVIYRRSTGRRLARAVADPAVADFLADAPAAQPGAKAAKIFEPFQRLLPRSAEEVSVVKKRLVRAGLRQKAFVNIFYGAKVVAPLLLCLLATVTGLYAAGGFFVYVMALGLGFLLPDFWLGHKIKTRQTNLRLGLPDALDLIVICVEAGLGMDRAILRTAVELHLSQPAIADELSLVSAEQRVGHHRADAWKNFGERTGVESIRALAAILIQADKFGTSVGATLRVHSETLRMRRRQDAEEMAAKTTVKLIFPLVLFIFPALFIVTLGPSMIIIMENLHNFLD
jgi:tight adherence protein C